MKDIRLPATAGSIIKASKRVTDSARHGAGLAAKSAREKAVALSNLSQGVLASALSVDLNSASSPLIVSFRSMRSIGSISKTFSE